MADLEGLVIPEETTVETPPLVASDSKAREVESGDPTVGLNIEGTVGSPSDLLGFEDSDNFSLVIKSNLAGFIADFNESIPIANNYDWYKETFVDPSRKYQRELDEKIKWANDGEKLAGQIVGSAARMAPALAIDSLTGQGILKVLKYANPHLAARLMATSANGTRLIADWVFGASAREAMHTFNTTDGDLIATGAKLAESLAINSIFGKAASKGIWEGAYWMGVTGFGLKAYEDFNRSLIENEWKMSSPYEYLFSAAETTGFHLAITAFHGIKDFAKTPYERTMLDGLEIGLKGNRVLLHRLSEMQKDPNINDEMKLKLRTFQTRVMDVAESNNLNYLRLGGSAEVIGNELARELAGGTKTLLLKSSILEKGVIEGLDKWQRGEIEWFALEEQVPEIADILDKGLIELDESTRTWKINTDVITDPDSNPIISKDGIKFKNDEALGSYERPVNPKDRGLDYMINRLKSGILIGRQKSKRGAKLNDFAKEDIDQIAKLLTTWSKVDPRITDSLTIEMWDRKEFVERLATEFHLNEKTWAEAEKLATDEQFGVLGEYNFNLFVIDLFLPFFSGSITSPAEIFAHEFGHHLTNFIPPAYIRALYDEFEMTKANYLDSLPTNVAEAMERTLRHGKVVVPEDAPLIKNESIVKYYRFMNVFEFWAETVRDVFKAQHRGQLPYDTATPFGQLMWHTHRQLLNFFAYFGMNAGQPFALQIYKAMLKGHIRTSTEGFHNNLADYFNVMRGFVPTTPPMPELLPDKQAVLSRSKGSEQYKLYGISKTRRETLNVELKKMKDAKELADQGIQTFDPNDFSFKFKDITQKELETKEKLGKPSGRISEEMIMDIVMKMYEADGTGNIPNELFRGLNPNHLLTSDEAKQIINAISVSAGEFIDAKRAVVQPRWKTEELAKGLEITLSFAQQLKKRTTFLARDVTGARMAMLYSLQRLVALKHRTLAEDATPQDAKALEEWTKYHVDLTANIQGAISEIGRALGSLNINVASEEILNTTSIEGLVKVLKKHDRKLGNRMFAAWAEVYRGWLFSSPGTQMVNTTGNLAVQIGKIFEDFFAVGIGRVANHDERMTIKEATARTAGMIQGAMNAGKYMADVILRSSEAITQEGFRAGEEIINRTQVEPYEDKWNTDTKAWTWKSVFRKPPEEVFMGEILAAGFDAFGILSRLPLNTLGFFDNAFRSVSFAREIAGEAVREADAQGLEGTARRDFVDNFEAAHKMLLEKNLRPLSDAEVQFVSKYVGDGTVFKRAFDVAKEDVFARDLKDSQGATGKLINKIGEGVRQHPLAQFLFPTFKTPINILRYVGQRTPGLHRLSSQMMDDIRAGGRKRDLAYAKLAYGTTLYLIGLGLAMSGKAPGLYDKDTKEIEQSTGMMKDSLVINGKVYSLQNVDPVGSFLSLPAKMLHILQNTIYFSDNTIHIGEYTVHNPALGIEGESPVWGSGGKRMEAGEAAVHIILALSALYTDKTFNRQLKEFLDVATSDTPKRWSKYGNRMASQLTTPMSGLARFANRGPDGTVLREAEGYLNNVLAVYTPEKVKPRFDLFGNPIRESGRFLGQIPFRTLKDDMVDRALREELPTISSLRDDEWRGVEITEKQQLRFQEILRSLDLREALADIISDPEWEATRSVPGSSLPGTRAWILKRVISRYRRAAWGELVMESEDSDNPLPELLESMLDDTYSFRRGRIGYEREE